MKKLAKRILHYLSLIPTIIWIPIETLIFILYEIVYRINRRILNGFSSEKYEENRLRRIVYKAIGASLRNHSNIMSSYHSRRIAKLFTFLLQLISLITTYAGFTFFLGALNPFAPLLIAIVVQGGCFYLLNYTASNKRSGQWRRYTLLFLLVIISIITSFMGIFNSIVSPIESMEDTYYSYVSATNQLLDYRIGKVFKGYTETQINSTYNYIKKCNTLASTNIDSKTISFNDYDTTVLDYYTSYDYWGNPYSSEQNVDDPDLVKTKESIRQEINELQGYYDITSGFLSSRSVGSVKESYNNLTDNPNKYESENDGDKIVYNEFQKAIAAAQAIDSIINGQPEEILQLSLDALEEYETTEKEYKDLYPNTILIKKGSNSTNEGTNDIGLSTDNKQTDTNATSFSDAIKEKSVFSTLNKLVVPEDLIEAESIRNSIISYVKSNYRAISESSDHILDTNSTEDITLKRYINDYITAYDEASNIESPQIMAFTNSFTNPNTLGKALFSLAIAIIVDGLSVLISYALLIKKRSSLYYDDISKYRVNREEMVEECFMYICLNVIKNEMNQKNCSEKIITSEARITSMVADKMNDLMSSFLKKIRYCYFPDEFNAFGYISKDDYDCFTDEEKRLFVTFCNIAMIQAFHQKEVIDLINHEFDEKDKQTNTPKANEELVKTYIDRFQTNQVYYVVSKSLHVWICENFSELLQNTMMFYDDEDSFNLMKESETGDDQSD